MGRFGHAAGVPRLFPSSRGESGLREGTTVFALILPFFLLFPPPSLADDLSAIQTNEELTGDPVYASPQALDQYPHGYDAQGWAVFFPDDEDPLTPGCQDNIAHPNDLGLCDPVDAHQVQWGRMATNATEAIQYVQPYTLPFDVNNFDYYNDHFSGQHVGPGYETDMGDASTTVYSWTTSAPVWLDSDPYPDPTGIGSDPLTAYSPYVYGDPTTYNDVHDPNVLAANQSDIVMLDDLLAKVYDLLEGAAGTDDYYKREYELDILRFWDHTRDTSLVPDGQTDEVLELYEWRHIAFDYIADTEAGISIVPDPGIHRPHRLKQDFLLFDRTIHDEGLLPWIDKGKQNADGTCTPGPDGDIDPFMHCVDGSGNPAPQYEDYGRYVAYDVKQAMGQVMIQPWDPTGACQWDFNTNTGNCPNLVVSGMDYYHEHNHRGTYTPDELPNSPTGDPYLDFVRAYNDPSDDPDGGDPTDISQGRDFKYAYPAGHDAVVKRTDEIDGH